MLKIFDLMMRLYPAHFRLEFETEMRVVFTALLNERTPWTELLSLIHGAARERLRTAAKFRTAVSLAGGVACAFSSQALLYRALLHTLAVGLFAGIAGAQPLLKQDPVTLETAKSIYQKAFTALRDAKNMDDMRKIADSLDAPEWISVDRFGRTLLTRSQADRELESMLAIPPEQRMSTMDIIWAEHDQTRMIVLAWLFPREEVRTGMDADPKISHRLSRATLIRDIFENTANGWRRIRHEKFLPNGTVLAVDGKSIAERNRVTPVQ